MPTYEELEQEVCNLKNRLEKFKQDDEALKESEGRFRTVIEQSPSPIEIYEPNGKLLTVNDAWIKYWNMTAEDIADFNIFDDPECERTGLTSAFKEALNGKATIVPEVEYHPEKSGFPNGFV